MHGYVELLSLKYNGIAMKDYVKLSALRTTELCEIMQNCFRRNTKEMCDFIHNYYQFKAKRFSCLPCSVFATISGCIC
jgi:hypothetical protein